MVIVEGLKNYGSGESITSTGIITEDVWKAELNASEAVSMERASISKLAVSSLKGFDLGNDTGEYNYYEFVKIVKNKIEENEQE